MKKHKCDGCKYKTEYQAMGFKPNGICSREHNLIQAEKSYNAEVCPFLDVNPDEMTAKEAEIERNREIIEYQEIVISALEKRLESEKTEAIKEFVANVKIAINERFSDEIKACNPHLYLMNTLLDDLVREITEESNDKQKT